jgi:hypothetical protein
MQKKDNAPCNNQPIRTKDQAQRKKIGSKKGRPKEENFIKKQVSLSIQCAYPSSQQGNMSRKPTNPA